MDAPIIELRGIEAAYGRETILKGISLSVKPSERWAVIGMNGAGKSTLIKIADGLVRPRRGSVLIDGIDIQKYSARRRAHVMAYVPQKPDGIIPYSVRDFVMLGRYHAMGVLGIPTSGDHKAMREAMDICDVGSLTNRIMGTLSGGELQRVMLAGAVVQQTPVLLLDEPTTFLDPAHERFFFDALTRLHERRPLSILMVTHDINRAMVHCTHIGALRDGRIIFSGPTEEFKKQCPGVLDKVFDVAFKRYICAEGGIEVFGTWEAPV